MNEWQQKAEDAVNRKNKLKSFGNYAIGLLVETKRGIFVVDPEDNSVTTSLLHAGDYSSSEIETAASLINLDSNVLIVGTHIGALAVPVSKLCKNMDAIEANPDTQKFLNFNLHLNNCSNVSLHCVAASDSIEKIEFLKNRDNSGGSKRKPMNESICYVYDDPEHVYVDAYPLDDLLGKKVYDLIIMDIEGSEYFALKGMPNILSEAQSLAIEFLPHHLVDVAGVTGTEFAMLLQPYFNWLYIPGNSTLIPSESFGDVLQKSYEAGRGYDAIYFLKNPSKYWMSSLGLSK